MGDWKDYEEYTAYGSKNPLLVFGAALDYREIGDTGVFSQTADVQYENPNGISLYGALYGSYTKNAPAGTGEAVHFDQYNWGAISQAGYLFQPKWEVFGRWGYLHLDDNGLPAGTHQSTNELTTGVNYYLHGQAAKFTLDVGWLPNGALSDDDGAGILANHGPDVLSTRTVSVVVVSSCSDMMQIGVGIIGFGRIGNEHAAWFSIGEHARCRYRSHTRGATKRSRGLQPTSRSIA